MALTGGGNQLCKLGERGSNFVEILELEPMFKEHCQILVP